MAADIFELGATAVEGGVTIPGLRLAYITHGKLNADKSNAILFPTWFGGSHVLNSWIIGPGKPLDPTQYFIVVVNIIGNGHSSSPSNTPAPFDGSHFPYVSVLDNVKAQRRLMTEKFGVDRLHLAIGRSMGAQIVFQWAAYYPDKVERLLPFVGSARTAHHNYIFLENVKMAVTSDPEFNGGAYGQPLTLAFERLQLVFDSWAASQAFYREELHLKAGFATTREYLDRAQPAVTVDANDVLTQVATWQSADLSRNELYNGDYEGALGAITARAIVMPSKTDLYFPPEDSEIEVSHMPNAELRIIPSIWGHRAGAPGTDPADIAFVEQAVRDILAVRP
ncbi:alpha/beta fold hydrolase [Flavisphingomonas formosensis]|uniref:alpha/beta fold hydrolase n=1 Tax=Flavisphingomonas formosensis TaxID=861534 RepID=UPI0012FC12C7|nr:alpha/beta fold hydrolase [Sphingomonas formosensis]